MKTKFTILGKPLSQNAVYRRRRGYGMFMTDEGKEYKTKIGYEALQAMKPISTFKSPVVDISLFFNNKRKNDIDGPIKLILDSLNGICWEDDSLVKELRVLKMYDKENPRIEISIEELNY